MAKLILNNITSGYASTTALNTAFDAIEAAMENTLSRNGTSPNTMSADLDLGSNDILNAGTVNATDVIVGGVSVAANVVAAAASAVAADVSADAALTSEIAAAASEAVVVASADNLADLEYMGNWVTVTTYLKNNIVYYSTNGSSYICLISHTSSADFATDLGLGRWGLLAIQGAAGAGTGDMLKSENLSGLVNYPTARSNLGLTIGTNVQAYDVDLTTLAELTHTDGKFIVSNGTTWVTESDSIARTSLGIISATTTAEGLVELATPAEAALGTDTMRAITPVGLFGGLNAGGSAPIYACRAWVNFNGTGTVAIRASGNVSSITDNGVGNYTVNFTTAMPDANYSTCGMGADAISASIRTSAAPTASAVSLDMRGHDGISYDPTYISIAIFR